MKTTENKTKRLEIRVTEDELKYLKCAAVSVGSTPSGLCRMFIGSTVAAFKLKVQKGEINLEDIEALLND